MKRFDVISIGGITRDYIFYTDKGQLITNPGHITEQRLLAFDYGSKINVDEAYMTFGGGAANAAVSLARLGLQVAVHCRVGNDMIGHDCVANLKRENVDVGGVQIDYAQLSGFSFIVSMEKKEREHVAFIHRGANTKFRLSAKAAALLHSPWVYLSGVTGKNWPVALKMIFQSAKKKSSQVMWNPGAIQLQSGKRMLQAWLSQTDILILNKEEAIELALSGVRLGRKSPKHLNRPIYLLNILREWGPKLVIVTDGEQGAWGYDGHEVIHEKIVTAKTINTTGVGDAFGSAFLAGYIAENGSMKRALKWGMINSASVVTKMGAQNGLLTRTQMLNRLT